MITTEYAGTCLSCDERYEVGELVNWEKGVGCWHADCPRPKNLGAHRRTVQQRRPLEPVFGQLPDPFRNRKHD